MSAVPVLLLSLVVGWELGGSRGLLFSVALSWLVWLGLRVAVVAVRGYAKPDA